MEIHGIRPELQPSALAEQASLKQQTQVLNEEVIKEAVGANHDAPGADEAAVDTSALTGLGGSLNITA